MRPFIFLNTALFAFFLLLGSAPTAAAQVTVNVTSPASSSVGTSFTLQANASSPNAVTGWYVYVDNNPVWSTPGPTSFISAPLSMGAGTHTVTVRAWDRTGAFGSRSVTLDVSTALASSSGVSVSVQTPSNGAGVGSPVTFQASASSPNGIHGWVIYMDNQNVYQVNNNSDSLSASVNLPGGTHTIYIRAWDRVSGYGTSSSFSINVGGGSSSGALPTPPSSAKVFNNIEDMSGFKSCSANCAGGQSTTNYWMAQHQSSPSMDGSSIEFFNGGSAWANVLWSKSLGPNSWASHFLWDFHVRYDSTTIANLWVAEFDLYQAVAGIELMIGSQCNFGRGIWQIWDQAAIQWIDTSIPCRRLSPDTWHRIQWYVERASPNQYRYKTLVVDGTPYSLNDRTFYGSREYWDDVIGVQWQLDLGAGGVDAHQWVDQVNLTIW